MIVFENGTYQTNSLHPDINYLEGLDLPQPKWVVPDGSELANKIISTPYWAPVTGGDGSLTDITPVEPPATVMTSEEQTAELKQQLVDIDLQTVRPLRAIATGTATDEDRRRLAELEAQAEAIRVEMKTIYET